VGKVGQPGGGVNPDVSGLSSAFRGPCCGVSVLTGARFEDIYPVTAFGRFIAALVGVLGIGMLALPARRLDAGFVEVMERQRNAAVQCPKCGHEFKQRDP